MKDILIKIGCIIKNNLTQKRYRVIAIVNHQITLCELDTNKFILTLIDYNATINLLINGELTFENDEDTVFDIDKLSDVIRSRYEYKLQIINEVIKEYEPSFIDLAGRKSKQAIKEIMEKYNCPRNSFWRICTSYFQSGMKLSSLVDERAFGTSKGKIYNYTKKPGRPPEYFREQGLTITPEIKALFKEALEDYKSGRQKSIQKAFERMSAIHFNRTEIINGKTAVVLKPQSERPTFWQFYNYISKYLTKEEKELIKTSAMEQRNNKRLLLSDSLEGVYGPGDMVEIDACEADVSLVSSFDSNRSVGRPIVYFMIDVYTRIILAVSVAFDNNSVLGITNLLLNLADDKKEYCARYGMGFDNDLLWPSNIIPRRIRVDRGSEFKSKEFDRMCNELGIEKQIVPGGSGSLKGVVEQAFHQMHSKQNVHLENYGLIEKRYDSNHHKEATLNIEQYTKMVINFVLTHNQQYFDTYRLTKDMMENKIKPIPALLWQYGIKKYGQPRPISSKEQFLYNLMTPINAKVSRKGIVYKDLWYLAENDIDLSREMFNAGNKRIPFDARMDMRCVGNIYYLRNSKLIKAPLNERLTGNAEYKNLTMKQWEDLRKSKKQMDAEGRVHNEEVAAFNYLVNNSLVNDAKKTSYSDDKNMRLVRGTEKQLVSALDGIERRLVSADEIEKSDVNYIEIDSTSNENSEELQSDDFTSWEDALQDCWNNNF